MKKVVRLTESDLIRIVKRVIQEDGGFTFGDKVKNKLKGAIGLDNTTDDESRLADDIVSAVESGDYEILKKKHAMGGPKYVVGYKISVPLKGGDYIVEPGNSASFGYSTMIETPRGEKFRLEQSGFTKKLIKLIKSSDSDYGFKYPR
jgi:hypothetical protein